MTSETLGPVLRRLNPWWEGRDPPPRAPVLIERFALGEVRRRLEAGGERRAILLLGPRQVGKTVLLHQTIRGLLERGVPAPGILFADLEDPWLAGARPEEILDAHRSIHGGAPPLFLFLDEIHYLPSWERHLRVLVDRAGARVVATGSGSSALLRGARETLQGRIDLVSMRGLSFAEFVRLRRALAGLDSGEEEGPGMLRARLAEYFDRGGFPEHARTPDLATVRERIRKDVAGRAIAGDLARTVRVRNVAGLERLFHRVAGSSGSIADVGELARSCGVSRPTADQWLRAIEQAFLAVRLYKTSGKRAPDAQTRPKIYASDPGLVSAFSISPQPPELLECAALRHLHELAERREGFVGYFRRDRETEIDFVVRTRGGAPLGIEVTTSETLRADKVASFDRALRIAGLPAGLLVHGGTATGSPEAAQGRMRILPAERFLRICSEPSCTTEDLWEAAR